MNQIYILITILTAPIVTLIYYLIVKKLGKQKSSKVSQK